jgi:hypothetical protein
LLFLFFLPKKLVLRKRPKRPGRPDFSALLLKVPTLSLRERAPPAAMSPPLLLLLVLLVLIRLLMVALAGDWK